MPFSERSGLNREPNLVSQVQAGLRRAGRSILDLTVSNPTQAGIPYDADAICRALADPRMLRYEPDPLGTFAAREAVCASWREVGVETTPERVLLTASTSEAYGYLFKLLCDPGDQVLIPAPSYPLFEHLARFEGVVPVFYPLDFDGAWYLDVARVRTLVGPRTRAIVIVSPNNPTGNFVKHGELEQLAALGIPLISDEVFARYPLETPRRAAPSALGTPDLLVFALSGLSKLAALPQLKLAWITASGPAPLVDEAMARLELVADTYLSASTPVLLALPELLRVCRVSELHIRARIAKNAKFLSQHLAESPITVRPIEGGWYAVLRLPNTRPEEAWATDFLSECGVLVQPGYFFDFADEPYAVVSLLTPESEFAEGIARIAREASKPSS